MFVKKEDFSCVEGLYKSLDQEERKKFLSILVKQAGKRAGEDVGRSRWGIRQQDSKAAIKKWCLLPLTSAV
ncbi:MAG: hypothetical protein M1497_00760 [Nitrospirae bacterium]|nr:hypothetical protein [Nitrospirota bacterium]